MNPEHRTEIRSLITAIRTAGFDVMGVGYMPHNPDPADDVMEVRAFDGTPLGSETRADYEARSFSVRERA